MNLRLRRQSLLFSTGAVCTAVSMYQLVVLELAHFYAMFSLGVSLLLSATYALITRKQLFHGWNIRRMVTFFLLLLASSVFIDRLGMHAGFWEYPHYGADDVVRKYVFEWTVALFYHFVALEIGIELFTRLGANRRVALLLSLLIIVTCVGFVTESLNLRVHSWRVLRMPITNLRFGNYYLVFQTFGYWLMALIPYRLYQLTSVPAQPLFPKDSGGTLGHGK